MKNILIYIDEPKTYEFIHSFFRGFIKIKLTTLPDIINNQKEKILKSEKKALAIEI